VGDCATFVLWSLLSFNCLAKQFQHTILLFKSMQFGMGINYVNAAAYHKTSFIVLETAKTLVSGNSYCFIKKTFPNQGVMIIVMFHSGNLFKALDSLKFQIDLARQPVTIFVPLDVSSKPGACLVAPGFQSFVVNQAVRLVGLGGEYSLLTQQKSYEI
jgi:hypothetical protein